MSPDPPTFRTRPQNVETDIGSSVVLSCDVDGQPQPEIRWLFHEPGRIGVSEYHDGIPLKKLFDLRNRHDLEPKFQRHGAFTNANKREKWKDWREAFAQQWEPTSKIL